MALQSVTPIAQLLHCSSNGRSPATQPLGNGFFVVDFVGLCGKSKRTRKKFEAASDHRTFPHFVFRNCHPVNVVLDLGRSSDAAASDQSAPMTPDLKPKVSRVTVRAKEAVEAAYYNKLGFRALLKPKWFEKKGRLLPKAARSPPKQKDKVDGSDCLPAPTKPIPFFTEDKELASAST